MAETDLRARELELEYRSFLDDEARDGIYKGKVEDMIKRVETRLIVNINDIRKNSNFKDRAKGLIEDSVEELVAFHRALKEYVISIDPVFGKSQLDFHVGLCGSFGACHVTPRTLTCSFMNKTVCVEGIVSKISLVKPKPLKSVLYCPVTQKYVERRHYDLASLDYQPTSMLSKDLHDENGNPLELECGLSKYKNHQTLTLQEMPERTPSGQLPRCVDVVLEYDLVDKCKPGDRVQVVGSYRSLPNKQGNFTNGIFRTIVIGNHVELMSKEVSMTLTDEDINNCKRISRSRRSNIFDRLALSLAPSIHGHHNVKKALLCLLLGGVEKHLPNGSRLRGDINILLIGDPSVAKSQLLRFVLGCAPRAIPTTGRGSSGVGLTAAVTTDPDTGDRRLEAGAMVLADRGIVCVDEFDKMSDIDRTAIHEVMEQGRVTICKAGIQARLNARCSVLAAANPVCGNYDPYKLPKDNIAMQDSLLSRFDLLFIMLDEHNRENDTHIAEHVSRIHRYRPQNELDGEPTAQNLNANYLTTMQGDKDDFEKTAIYEKHNPLLHGHRGMSDRHFSMDFLRKYIHIAKLVKPTLSREACEMISEHYWNLRNMDKEVSELAKTQPITARTLETMIRLATAHAKARLSTVVDAEDAGEAINLLQYCVYQKVLSKPKIKRRKNIELEDGASEFEDDEETCDSTNISTRKRRRTEAGPGGDTADSPDDLIEDAPMETTEEQPQVNVLDDEEKETVRPQLPKFKELLNDLARKNKGAMVLDLDLVYQTSTEQLELDRPRTEFLLGIMSDEGLLVLDNNCLFFT